MKKLLLVALAIVLLPAAAQFPAANITPDSYPAMREALRAQAVGVELPGPIAALYGNEVINGYVGGHFFAAARTEGGKISAIYDTEQSDYTLAVKAKDWETVGNIVAGTKPPLEAFQEAKANGDVTIEARGIVGGIKLFFATIGMALLQFFGVK